MKHHRLAIALFFSALIIPGALYGQRDDGGFDLTVGIGYDKITQDYYLARIDTLTLDEDSLTYLKQTSDALDDLSLKTRIEWATSQDVRNSLRIDNLTDVSNDEFRNNLGVSFRRGAITLENDFQTRGIWSETETARRGYVSNTATGRYKPEIADGLFLYMRNSFELVRYDGRGDYSFDNNYNKLSIGVEKEFGWTDFIALTYRNDLRSVSDSSRLDFTRHRARLEADWSPSFDLSFSLHSETMRIESAKENDLDDAWEQLVETGVRVYLGEKWTMRFKNAFEYAAYDTQDVVNFNYVYNTAELSISNRLGNGVEPVVKPSWAVFRSEYIEFEQQDYSQYAIEYGFDVSAGDWLWLTVSHKFGRRDYINETDEFYTDYVLNQLNLFGDLKIYHGLRLSLILSVDWENHDLKGDDNSLSLLSAGLDYRF